MGDVVHHCPESVKIYADRVVENVAILWDSIECIAMPATDSNFMKEHVSAQPAKLPEPGVSSSSGVKPSAAPPAEGSGVELGVSDKALADDVVSVCPPRSPVESVADESEQGGPLIHSSEDDGEEGVKTLNHSLAHYPKSRHCEICKRAKMTS